MEVKLFEIRDKATFIPAMAIKLVPRTQEERYLLGRSGYSKNMEYVFLLKIGEGTSSFSYDPFSWGNRTMTNAHCYIKEHFDELKGGEVIDVEYILGESSSPKISESTIFV